jgi:hypothetical protein
MKINIASAQQSFQKHPRVMEMERQMTKDALDFLKSRFPEYPIIVTVSIDPILRVERRAKQQSESLPYFRLEEEEIVDEWDDPAMSNSSLMNRVRKIVINVSAPGHITDDEVAEIKQSLFLNLNMLQARDIIEINKRSWGKQKEPEFEPLKYIWLAFGGFFLFYVSLLLAIWTPIRQLVRVLKDGVAHSKPTSSDSGNSSVIAMSNWKNTDGGAKATSGREDFSAGGTAGDVRFNDPIRIQSAIAVVIGQLARAESFPTLDDMVVLDEVCKTNTALIGALLMEFPLASREKIFSLSYGNHWLEALTKPGVIDIRMYEIVHRLNRNPRSNADQTWQRLLILIWRLYDRRGEFLRELEQGEALAILYSLPKGIALKTAREMYPGSWAALLDPRFQPKVINPDRLVLLSESALKMFELRTMVLVEKFKQDKDLIHFLRSVDVTTEKEIYTASSKDSILHQMRPPFYKIFDAAPEALNEFVPQIALSDWAIVLSNINHLTRRPIESNFGKKQKIRFLELLNQYEIMELEPDVIGAKRESVALQFSEFQEGLILKNAKKTLVSEQSFNEEKDDKKGNAA